MTSTYESKQKQYFDFMQRIDAFNGCVLEVVQEDLRKIMELYYRSDSSHDSVLSNKFNELAISSLNKLRSQQAELFSQSNSLKLSASVEINNLVASLSHEISIEQRNLEECITYIGSEKFRNSGGHIPDSFTKTNNNQQSIIVDLKNGLMEIMRKELDDI